VRILHTSDWHLGRTLHDKRRHGEHEEFLGWLEEVVLQRHIDLLLICGDVFDTVTPGNKSLELYYSFLRRVVDGGCRHVVVIGGNHDSPSLLDAPKGILEHLGVHVVGAATEDEVLLLHDGEGQVEAIVCAVPFLHDRDVRDISANGDWEEKEKRLVAGIRSHYADVQNRALSLRETLGGHIPIIVTGHMFASGGKVTEGDGVRDLYVGTAAAVPSSLFDDRIDYVALGHLHVPQKVAGKEHVRYSGSPLPMGFGEAGQKKQVVVIDFSHDSLFPLVETMDLPVFQTLLRIGGTLEQIESRLQAAVDSLKSIWVEVNYDGTLSAQELGKQLDMIVQGSQVEILRLKNTRLTEHVLGDDEWHTTLDDLDEKEVFRRRLELEEMEDDEKTILTRLYGQVLQSLREEEAL